MTLCILGREKTETNLKLLEEAKKKFSSVFFVPMEGIGVGLSDDFSLTYRTTDLLKFKAVLPRVPRQSYSYAYQLLSLFPSDTFMPVPPIAFLMASERFFLLTVLRKRQVETLNLHLVRSVNAAERIIDALDFPFIIRVPTQKTGVTVKGRTEAKSIIEALGSLKHPVLIEDVVKDVVSAYVAKPDVVAAVKKTSHDQDMVFGGGSYKEQKLGVEARQLALEAADATGAQVVRVDMTMKDGPKVVNMEMNPNLITPSRVCKANVPRMVMESVYDNYRHHQDKPLLMKFFDDAKSVVRNVLKDR